MVSVIIPSYNREKVIKKSIESVLNQSYSDLEVIVVDDGSIDDTKQVVESINDDRVKYIYQENQGACVARNTGIANARGDFIAFQDSDDEWLPSKLEKQLELFSEDVDFVSCGMKRNTVNKLKSINITYDITLENLLKYNVMSTQTMIMRKEVCSSVKFDPSFKRLQDWDYAIQVFLSGFKMAYLNDELVLTNDSDNSITSNVNLEKSCMHLIEKYKEYYDKYPKSIFYIYMNIARSLKKVDREKTNSYLVKCFKLKPSLFVLAKIVLNKFGLWK